MDHIPRAVHILHAEAVSNVPFVGFDMVFFQVISGKHLKILLSPPISKKHLSILMFSVLPKRCGQVNRLASPQMAIRSASRPVLST